MDLELIIWAGVLTLVLFLVIIWLLVVHIQLLDLKKKLKAPRPISTFDNNGVNRPIVPKRPESVYSYGSPALSPDEELSQRGFQSHGPSSQRPYNPIRSQTTQYGIRGNQDYNQQPPPTSMYNKNPPRNERTPTNTRNDNFIY